MKGWTIYKTLLVLGAVCALGCGGKSQRGLAAFGPGQGASSAAADSMWVVSEGFYRRGKWNKLAEELDRLALLMPPNDARRSRLRYLQGEAKLGMGDPLSAARDFRKVSDETPSDSLAPDALLRAGDAFFQIWKRPELDDTYGKTALATYQELVNRYPASVAAKRAQLHITQLQDWFALKSFKAAQYYMRLKAYDSAILYLRDLVATYPRSSIAPQALLRLVQAYSRLGYEEDVRETCGYIRRFHSGAPGVDQVCPAAPPGA